MENATDKIVDGVNNVLANNIKCRKIGVLVACIGVGLIAVSYVK